MAHFKLELVSREDHIKALPKSATSGVWTVGDLLTEYVQKPINLPGYRKKRETKLWIGFSYTAMNTKPLS